MDDGSRNRTNRALATATYEWKTSKRFGGKLILPLIFTHFNQLKGKTKWKKKLDIAKECYELAGADGIWVVDQSLSDQQGWTTFRDRFSELIKFHEALNISVPEDAILVAGPYWGMNLVLWSRGLCDCPAISVGAGYRYFIPTSTLRPGAVRIAIPPVRRPAIVNAKLKKWLDESLKTITPKDDAYKSLQYLRKNFNFVFTQKDAAREEVAGFYRKWFDKIDAVPPTGRPLALYQDLSSAYVLGRRLPEFPSGNGSTKAEGVAEYLMLSCL